MARALPPAPPRPQGALRADVVDAVRSVQRLPFVWPGPPHAEAARRAGAGTCASKHALLAEYLDALGVESFPLLVVGPLVPAALADDAELAGGRDLVEVHECLTILTPWAGPLRVDVTVDPALATLGIPATLEWDGVSDMALAVETDAPGWAVARAELRPAKEALRRRLYLATDRARRDAILRRLSDRYAAWRAQRAMSR